MRKEKIGLDKEIESLQDEINNFEDKMAEFRNAFDKTIMILNEIKKEVHELREKYSHSLEEKDRLHIRAAAGFDNLTPRPNYKEFSHKFVSEVEFYDRIREKSLNSTANIFE